jgi:hypothetical protein
VEVDAKNDASVDRTKRSAPARLTRPHPRGAHRKGAVETIALHCDPGSIFSLPSLVLDVFIFFESVTNL